MKANTPLDDLNSVRYLYLRSLSEPRDNSLRIVVEEAIVNPAGSPVIHPDLPELQNLAKDASPIESIEGCKTFELLWKHYIAYLVTEECVGSCGSDHDESYTGVLFRIYSTSHFLNHLAVDTGGHTEPIRHYKILCLNHLIDVASYSPPAIRILDEPASGPVTIQ